MRILVLNGSPHKNGTVATLLKSIVDGISNRHEVEWINVYDLKIKPCIACMKCRQDKECILPQDDGHIVGRKIRDADGLIVGTPTHWGNMSGPLKLLFDRNVPVFMGEKPNGMPYPRQTGKPAVIVTACTTPWPFNFIAAESRGAIRAVNEVLHYGGYRLVGKVVKSGTKNRPVISNRILNKAKILGNRF
ncbi:iron-sulfur protein [Methanosarcina sp. 1.H.T.1A.1]|uniref:flavodoxin family protein n=1 Tax=Methanosarcina sp. 1.H.T.1A.1 TaxID=1483602 RepID=UPI0006229044|nr:flavodoxin family protein [Methanosarcina sp. 1.H.T.1A.1]KKH95852.1 iron-sulfur protein [Methanosarcina sp. 1.H.T.1A.1]